jgi:predicted HAD superfamily Cof-like phosphohydrolase
MVREFHFKGGQPVLLLPTVPSDERIRLRAKLVMEEAFETVAAMYGNDEALQAHHRQVQDILAVARVDVDLPKVADGCADLDYVVEGTRLELGINGLPIAKTVHAANMAKFGPGSWKREDGKQMKPPGWKPPDIEAELKKQGWTPTAPSALDASSA